MLFDGVSWLSLRLHVGPLVLWVAIGPWSWPSGVPLVPWRPPVPRSLAFGLVPVLARPFYACWRCFGGYTQGVHCICCVA